MHLLALVLLIGQASLADSVKQTFRDYERRLNAGDYAGLAKYYADDPRFYWVEDGTVAAGQSWILASHSCLRVTQGRWVPRNFRAT